MNKKILLVLTIKQSTILTGYLRALGYLGWDVRIFDYRKLDYPGKILSVIGKRDIAHQFMNKSLIETSKNWKPDFIFVVKGSVIFPETIRAIQKLGILTVNWFPDDIQAYNSAKSLVPIYDICLHYDLHAVKQLQKDTGKKNIKLFRFGADILPTDDEVLIGNREYNLTMIGFPYDHRKRLLPMVSDLGLHVWGNKGWGETSLKQNYHGFLPSTSQRNIFQNTKVGLNLQYVSPCEGLTSRPYLILASKAMLLNDYRKDLYEFFDVGRDVVCCRNDNQLRELAVRYLNNDKEREAIAERGYRVVRSKHTYVHRFAELFKELSFV